MSRIAFGAFNLRPQGTSRSCFHPDYPDLYSPDDVQASAVFKM